MEHMASLEELEKTWSIDDVLRMNALLDMRQAVTESEVAKVAK